MEGNGPDLGKILKMVTDNPALLQSAISFAGKLKENSINDKESSSPPITVPVSQTNFPSPIKEDKIDRKREDEKQLLLALRPYLSKTRREKIDFILKILQLLELAGSLGLTLDVGKKGGETNDV